MVPPQIARCCLNTRVRILVPTLLIVGVLLTYLQVRQMQSRDSIAPTIAPSHWLSVSNGKITKTTAYPNLGSLQNGFSQTLSPQKYTKYTNGSSAVEVMESGSRSLRDQVENMTIVTAYFNLGTFKKGTSQTFSQKTYINWIKTFKYMQNNLVVYTDSKIFADLFRNLRKGMAQRTKVLLVDRSRFWTFRIHERIQKIYSQKGYPRHYPNTVLPGYSCVQHSKYALVADTINQQYFKSKCYAWLDIGYFRDILNSKRSFILNYPNDYDRDKLAMNLVFPSVSLNTSYKKIVYNNQVWVGGGMFLGTADIILAFEAQYKRAVMFLLDKQLISTDQQVILSMYSRQGRTDLKSPVQLQLYSRTRNETDLKNGNPWFYLGYKCLTFT